MASVAARTFLMLVCVLACARVVSLVLPPVNVGRRGGCAWHATNLVDGQAREFPPLKEGSLHHHRVPEPISDVAFHEAWLAAEKKAGQNMEQGVWEPILVADNVPEDVLEKFVWWQGYRVYFRSVPDPVTDALLSSVVLFGAHSEGHHDLATATLYSSYRPYVEANRPTLFDLKDDPSEWKLKAGPGLRVDSGYQAVVNGELINFTAVPSDRSISIMRNGKTIASPVVSEFDVVLRSLPQLIDHCGQLFRCRSDLNVFQGYVVDRRQPIDGKDGDRFGGPFAAYYFQCARNFGSSSSPFRVEKLLSIGTAAAQLHDHTYEDIVATLKKHGVTEVCGQAVDTAFDFKKAKEALTDLSDVQRRHLKDAVDNDRPDAPTSVQRLLKFEIPSDTLFEPGSDLEKRSTPLDVDLYTLIYELNLNGEPNFEGAPKTPP